MSMNLLSFQDTITPQYQKQRTPKANTPRDGVFAWVGLNALRCFQRACGKALLGCMASICVIPGAPASVIDFRAASIEQLDEQPSFELDIGSRAITVTALGGLLNRTSRGFGINAPGTGDDTDGIDGNLTREALEVRFDAPVIIESVTLSNLGRQDVARLLIGPERFLVNTNGPFSTSQTPLPTALPLFVSHGSGNGFSLDAITFALPAASAPQLLPSPSSVALTLAPLAWLAWRRRPVWRRRSVWCIGPSHATIAG